MTEAEVQAIFTLAGIEVLKIKPLIDGYGYPPDDSRFFETKPRCVWWFVKTDVGWIEIGWRKRVISINWEDTPIRMFVTKDDVTKEEHYAHAWDNLKAVEYLKTLAAEINARANQEAI